MSLAVAFDTPLFTGVPTVVGTAYDVALGGHGYMLDWKSNQFGHESIDMIRTQADTSGRPGEATLNPAGPWRRVAASWHHGAGQEWLDRDDADPYRFWTSKGVNPWDRYALTLLPDTESKAVSVESNLWLVPSGGRLYMAAGQGVQVTGVGDETLAAATGLPAADVEALASDGQTCYAACGASGIYTATGTVFASYATGDVDLVRYANGRLMAANGPNLYNVTAGGALPTPLLTHPASGWTWTDATEAPGHIYLSGYAGDKSAIYRTNLKTDASGLEVPVVAAPLPDGEIAHTVCGYLGFVVIGTNLGVRFAVPNTAGDLELGSLVETSSPVLCAEPQSRFVWYGLSDYDATSTGLGRLDLRSLPEPVTPAYASDLMATGQGDVLSVVTYGGKRWFTVSGLGLYTETADTVASGTLTTGEIEFGLPEVKTLLSLDVRHDPLPNGATVAVAYSGDGGSAVATGTSGTVGSSGSAPETFTLGARVTRASLTLTLTGGAVLRRVTLRADPAAERSSSAVVPILLHDRIDVRGVTRDLDVLAEYRYLIDLFQTRTVFLYQERGRSFRAVMEDYRWRPYERSTTDQFFTGTFYAQLKGV